MEYYLCVLDFEATCWENSVNKDQMEIIEFSSVLYKINESTKKCDYVSEFSNYVKPTINPQLSEFCTNLTGITQAIVNSAETIDKVFTAHTLWIDKHVSKSSNFIIATCGHWDLRTQLPREIAKKKLKQVGIYRTYINVKDEFEYFYQVKAGGLKGMLEHLNLKFDGKHHSGIDDAKNTAKIMFKIIQDNHKFNNFKFNYVK